MEKKDLRAFVRAKKRAMTPAQVEAASVVSVDAGSDAAALDSVGAALSVFAAQAVKRDAAIRAARTIERSFFMEYTNLSNVKAKNNLCYEKRI